MSSASVLSSSEASRAVHDSGLGALALVARLHGLACDPTQIAHDFALGSSASDLTLLLRAARKLGLKANTAKADWD